MKCFFTNHRRHQASKENKTGNCRGQSSLEFAVLAGMFMVVFIIFFYFLSSHIIEFKQQRDARAALDLLFKVESELTLALRVHDGYAHTFRLPSELYGKNYSIVLNFGSNASEVAVEYNNRSYIMPVLVNLTTDSKLGKGKNKIQKAGGNITVFSFGVR